MENLNQTNVEYFELLGFAVFENNSPVFFAVFFIIYIFTLIGNMLIVLVVYNDIRLHTPMYFFITNLSCLEIWYVSTTTPKLLTMLLTKNKKISFYWCLAQIYMFHSLGITECNLLAVMAIDRFMAICRPLRYSIIMSTSVCRGLSIMCWMIGFLTALFLTTLTFQVPFCGRYYINHYFCDLVPILSLACCDVTFIVAILRFLGAFLTIVNITLVAILYVNIIHSILKIKTNTGRKKAFSTCSSHLTVVTLFYGAAFNVYASPKTDYTVENGKLFALVYAMFTPLLNPIIYSLRNQEVKSGLKRGLQRMKKFITER